MRLWQGKQHPLRAELLNERKRTNAAEALASGLSVENEWLKKRLEKVEASLEEGEALLEILAEDLPEDDVSGVMMRAMAERHRNALAGERE